MKKGFQNLKCGLIGEKLGHSFSAPIHNELADYSFVLRELSPCELEAFVKSRELDAYCVTIPYKKAVIPFIDEISTEAKAIGAVNVIVNTPGGKIKGYNSDYFGFEYMLNSTKVDVKGKKALVLGRGGASATVCAVLRDKGISEIAVVGSKDNTAENLARHGDSSIIVNATPVGMYPNNGISPIELSAFPNCEAVLDLIYNPSKTALMIEAEKRGIVAVNGLSMLVAQAAKAFEYFTEDTYENGCIERITEAISRQTQNVVLIGMPGCGKSTVGQLLAKTLSRDFFDADSEFTATYGITPANAINTLGEEKFRAMEHEILLTLGKKSSVIIATGGGAVTKDINYAPLHQNGIIVFIERDINELSIDGRPLSQKKSVKELYRDRLPKYKLFADITLSSAKTPEDTACAIKNALGGYNFK